MINYSVEHSVSTELFQDLKEIASRPFWEDVQKSTFLITGGAGFIAYHLALCVLIRNDLFQNENRLVLLVRNSEKAKKRYGELLYRTDVKLLTQDVCTEISPDCYDFIIHAAGGAEASEFENRPVDVFNTNTIGTNQILSLADRSNAKSVVYVSSFTVYGKMPETDCIIQEDRVGLLNWTPYVNCYANGKRSGELLCNCYLHQYGVPVKIIRPGFVYGASSWNDTRVYADIIRNAGCGQNIILKSSGLLYRSMCYVTDLVRGLFSVLLSGENGAAYNIATEYLSIRDFANNAVKAFPEKKIQIVFQNPLDEQINEPKQFCGQMDCSQLSKLSTPWEPQITSVSGIEMAGKQLQYMKYEYV